MHIVTLHIITIRGKSSKPSSSSRRRRIEKRRKEVDHDQAHTRTLSWNFTFRIRARQAPEHLRLLISINLRSYLCTAFECLSLEVDWIPILCMFNFLDLRKSMPPFQLVYEPSCLKVFHFKGNNRIMYYIVINLTSINPK